MEVLVVEPSGRGNLAQHSHGLCTGLTDRGNEVSLFTSTDYELEEHADDYEVIKQPSDRLTPLNYLALLKRIVKKEPDVVHLQWFPSPLVYYAGMRMLRQLRDVPLVYTAHHVISHRRMLHHHNTYGKMYELFDGIVTHSEQNRARILDVWGLEPEKVRVMPHGGLIDLEPGNGEQPEKKSLLFFGHVNRQKGADTLVEAMKELDDDYRLTVAGKGASEFENGDDHVETVDTYVPVEDVKNYFQSHDLVVLPHNKPCTTPLIAAARNMAKPAVVSDMVENSDEGACYTFKAGDSDDLAEKVKKFYQNGEKLREEAEEMSAQMTWTESAEKTETLYHELVST